MRVAVRAEAHDHARRRCRPRARWSRACRRCRSGSRCPSRRRCGSTPPRGWRRRRSSPPCDSPLSGWIGFSATAGSGCRCCRRAAARRRRRPPPATAAAASATAVTVMSEWCAAARPLAVRPRPRARRPRRASRCRAAASSAAARDAPRQGASRPSRGAGETSSPWRVGMPSSAVGKAVWGSHRQGARRAPRRAVGFRTAVDGHVPAGAAVDGARPVRAGVGGAADDPDVDARAWPPGSSSPARSATPSGAGAPCSPAVASYAAASLLCAVAPTISAAAACFHLIQAWPAPPGSSSPARSCATCTRESRRRASSPCSCSSGGLAPILAPLVGGELLHVTDWRGIFVVLAGIGALLLVSTWMILR